LTALGCVILLSCWFVWQQESIVVDPITVPLPDLPSSFEGLRIAHLSDLHGKEFGKHNGRLLSAVESSTPDLIVLPGDFIDRPEQIGVIPTLADGLSSIAPTYFVTGNHDWAAADSINHFKALFTDHGVTVLSGEYVTLTRKEEIIVLAGLDDPNGLADQTTGSELRARISNEVGENVLTILLSHRDTLEIYAPWNFDLTFCGHGHGGIFRIPLADKGILGADRSFFPDYDGGLFTISESSYVVSRGLGSNTVPFHAFRLFNRPHIPLAILTSGS